MTPQLRFPEFTDEWQVKKLGDTVKFEQGVQVDLPQQKPTPFEDSVKFLRIENYTQKSQDFRYISKKIAGKKYINDDEVAVVRYGATAGFIATGQSGVLANNLFSVRSNGDSISNKFLSLRLKQPRTYSYFQSEMSGGAMPALSFSIVSRYKFAFPSKPEQEKIADFLTAVDERIAVGEKRLELLETYKRGVMQQIFSQQVRFKDDNGNPYPDWEEKKLGDVFIERDGKGGALENMLSVTIKNGIVPFSTIDRKDNSSVNKSNYKKVVTGDIAYNSMRMWQGASGVSGYDGIVSPAYTVITPKPGNISTFWGYYFKLPNVIFIFERYSQGLTSDTWNLKFKQLSEISLYAPGEKEQQKISDFLATLDDKITSEKSKLTAARQFKKALLQRMFV